MSNDDKGNSTFTGTVLVKCDVLVSISGSTTGDIIILRQAAEEEARRRIRYALAHLFTSAEWPISAEVTGATAAELTIVWIGEKS